MHTDEIYMQRCIDLALPGLGHVAPNPLVGAVLVLRDKIIGEGYHRQYGGHHAEVEAIRAVTDKSLLKRSTLYVNLEPCCHHGKTPPCTDLILRSGIPRVVIGTVDPFDSVAGKGVARLRSQGVDVRVGVVKEACRELNKRFFTFHEKKRPYVILKWAQTADGFIDIHRQPNALKRPTWITSEKLRMLVHKWRTEERAILVGTETALKDNPMLNVRDWHGPAPTRILIDRKLQINDQYNLLDDTQPTLIFNEKTSKVRGKTEFIQIPFDKNILPVMMDVLYQKELQSLIVEGGKKTLQSFIDENVWDEARIFTGNQFFCNGIKAPDLLSVKNKAHIIIGQEGFYRIKNS